MEPAELLKVVCEIADLNVSTRPDTKLKYEEYSELDELDMEDLVYAETSMDFYNNRYYLMKQLETRRNKINSMINALSVIQYDDIAEKE